MLLLAAREAVTQRFRHQAKAHGLTEQQWRVVRALAEVESLEIIALSAVCHIHSASLSRILPKLGKAGLISRCSNAADHRRVIVSLTPRGRRLLEELMPDSRKIYQQLARDVGPDLLARAVVARVGRIDGERRQIERQVLPIVPVKLREERDVDLAVVGRCAAEAHHVAERRMGDLAKDAVGAPLSIQDAGDPGRSGARARVQIRENADVARDATVAWTQYEANELRVRRREAGAVGAEEHAEDLLEHAQRVDVVRVAERRLTARVAEDLHALRRPLQTVRFQPQIAQ